MAGKTGKKKDVHNIVESLVSLAVPIGDLHPDMSNARAHSVRNVEVIRSSLERWGQRKPIVANKRTGLIEAGHGVWMAAKELGWTHVAVVWVEDEIGDAKAFGLADNKSALLSDWDFDKLEELIRELQAQDFDMTLTGFSPEELMILGAGFEEEEPERHSKAAPVRGEVAEPYRIFLSFSTRELAEKRLAENGIDRKFIGDSRQIAVNMG